MDYLLQEPRSSHLKFVWRIAPILKEKFNFDSLHISHDVDFSTVLSFVCMNQEFLLLGSFCRVIFWGLFGVPFLVVIFGGHFGGHFGG